MELASREELLKSICFLDLDWKVQNNVNDEETRFIYYCQRLEQVISLSLSNNVDVGYAIHRWFNYHTSKNIENIICENGAKHCENEYDHDVDLYINDIPFDVKVSIISKKYKGDTNLFTRKNKNEYMKWLKENASKENRKHDKNRLFIICDSQKSKCDFELIDLSVKRFFEYIKDNEQWNEEKEKCELIYIKERNNGY